MRIWREIHGPHELVDAWFADDVAARNREHRLGGGGQALLAGRADEARFRVLTGGCVRMCFGLRGDGLRRAEGDGDKSLERQRMRSVGVGRWTDWRELLRLRCCRFGVRGQGRNPERWKVRA